MPAELRSFDPAMWLPLLGEEPPEDVQNPDWWRVSAAFRLWSDARRRWDAEHGWWPGDSLDRLKEELAASRALWWAEHEQEDA